MQAKNIIHAMILTYAGLVVFKSDLPFASTIGAVMFVGTVVGALDSFDG